MALKPLLVPAYDLALKVALLCGPAPSDPAPNGPAHSYFANLRSLRYVLSP